MLASLLLALIAILGGALLTYHYDQGAPFVARLCTGACTGFALLALFGFILASLLGFTPLSLVLTAALLASPFALLMRQKFRAEVRDDLSETARVVRRAILHPTWHTILNFTFYSALAILLWYFFDRAMFEREDGLYTGVVNNLGDLPFHLGVITSFVHGGNFPPEDPSFAGTRFTYPFLSDFVAACFFRAGASLRDSMFIQNIVLSLALVGVLHRWTLAMTRDRAAAFLTPLLVLLSGGFGWWYFLLDLRQSGSGIFELLKQLPRDYTIAPDTTLRWGNALTTLFITQRSILFGLPLAIIVFTQWWLALNPGEKVKGEGGKEKKGKGKGKKAKGKRNVPEPVAPSLSPFPFPLSPSAKRMLAAGVVAGMLPLIHAHTFLVVMGVGGCLALLFWRWREWAIFFAVALMIAVPEMFWVTRGSAAQAQTFLGWHFGWDHGEENVLWFWLKNTGLFIPLIIAALMWRGKSYLVSRRLLFFYAPFTLCFIIPNLIKLAPWVWDNIKVLFYWYVASAPIVALLLARLWRLDLPGRILALVLVVSLTLAGGLDVWRIVTRTTEYQEYDRDGMALAQKIVRSTPPRSLILHAPTYNPAIFLTGRRSLLGYTGYIWAHGLDYIPRENDIKSIYAGAPGAESLLAKYDVDYVIVSPLERNYMPVNNSFFERYEKVAESGEYRLYKIKRP